MIKEGLDSYLADVGAPADHTNMARESVEAGARRAAALAKTAADKAAQSEAAATWAVGDTVTLTAGPFAGFKATVTDAGKGVVRHMGKEWPVTF